MNGEGTADWIRCPNCRMQLPELSDLLEQAKAEHSIDQQTHGLKFGMSKENCATCAAILKVGKWK